MILEAIAWTAVALAALPAALFTWNLLLYRRAPRARQASAGRHRPAVSVLIPARDEESSIGPAVLSALASRDVDVEVVVLDDHSRDRTASVVEEIAVRDPRARCERGPELPAGWCGKQHACWTLSRLARYELLVFVDADVRLEPDALARMARFLDDSGADLVSGFPRQVTGTLVEHAVIPLMNFILLGYLPMFRMRRSAAPAYGAGCGQLFMTRRAAYEHVGGHSVIRGSLHDGIKLPRAYRAAGHRTDLFDASDLARCRMYRSAAEVWRGLAKNATEGMASAAAIGPWTLLLAGGHVLPLLGAIGSAASGSGREQLAPWLLAVALSMVPRVVAAVRFRQALVGAVLHPFGVAALVVIQWQALVRSLRGRPATWKGRPYCAAGSSG